MMRRSTADQPYASKRRLVQKMSGREELAPLAAPCSDDYVTECPKIDPHAASNLFAWHFVPTSSAGPEKMKPTACQRQFGNGP